MSAAAPTTACTNLGAIVRATLRAPTIVAIVAVVLSTGPAPSAGPAPAAPTAGASTQAHGDRDKTCVAWTDGCARCRIGSERAHGRDVSA